VSWTIAILRMGHLQESREMTVYGLQLHPSKPLASSTSSFPPGRVGKVLRSAKVRDRGRGSNRPCLPTSDHSVPAPIAELRLCRKRDRTLRSVLCNVPNHESRPRCPAERLDPRASRGHRRFKPAFPP